MAIVSVNLIDTFDEWRIKTNSLGSTIGDLTSLTTTDKTNIVAAINEVVTNDSDDMEHLLDDTTPQLGGNLDLNNFNLTGTGAIDATVTGYTQSASDNSTKLATTAYVDAQVATENTIAEMDDVTLTSIADNNILQWNTTLSVWENKTTSAAGLLSNVVEDATPQLGGDLSLNSNDITGTGNINITGSLTVTQLGGDLSLNSNDITGTGNINITGSLTATSIAGSVTSTTQASNDNTTKIATTAFVQTAAAAVNTDLVNDTTPQLGGNLDLNSSDITGSGNINITGIVTATSTTQSPNDNSTKLATTAYVDAATSTDGATESFAVGMAIALG
jgi:hypothetical protein